MTIVVSKEMKDTITEMNLEDGFMDELAARFDNEYVDPNGETVFVFEFKGKKFMIEGRVEGQFATLLDIGPVTTLQAK